MEPREREGESFVAENVDKTDALFVNLVLLFKNAALQQMGKIMSPISGKIEKTMEQARFSIDMIEMLKAKTRGNISDDLDRLLDSTLLELRMNYVEEVEAGEKQADQEKASGEAGESKEEPAEKPGPGAETQPPGGAAREAHTSQEPGTEGAGHNTTKERSSSKPKGKRSGRKKESG
jgi:hypothetical protein